jgi:hypothetical protein
MKGQAEKEEVTETTMKGQTERDGVAAIRVK